MSQGEFEAKFPGQVPAGLPPSPSRENPGRVFPKSDPHKVAISSHQRTTPDQFVGNPYLMNRALDKVDHSFGEVIAILEQEERSQDRQAGENALLRKFKAWRNELERIRVGEEEITLPKRTSGTPPGGVGNQGSGMFID